jgi:NitT/TauT family transport system substrate-binding protein
MTDTTLKPGAAARTRRLLDGPIVPLMLKIAAPNLVVNVVLISVTTGVDAHFATSPFHEQEIKIPGVRTLTTNYEILGGPATALVIAASTRYREANPKSYKAFFDALKEAIGTINKDKRAASKIYLDEAKDTKNAVEDIYAMISASDYAYTLVPQKVGKTAEFMYKIGSIKTKPTSWKDLFFPEVSALPGD